jgi:hypothetical protein
MLESSTMSYILADPEQLLLDWSSPTREAPEGFRSTLSNATDCFERIPSELVFLILRNLKSDDVCKLRLCSRYVASISGVRSLPQSFWATRFGDEFEMGFFLVGQNVSDAKEETTDWRELYSRCRVALRSTRDGESLRNKRRIWQVLGQMSEAFNLVATSRPKPGCNWAAASLLSEHGVRMSDLRVGPTACANLIAESHPGEDLRPGCRVLTRRRLIWPSSQTYVGVSFVWINSQYYISGLRVGSEDVRNNPDSSAVGFVIPSTEELFLLSHGDELKCLEVAANNSGLVGLRFIVWDTASKRDKVHTMGDFASSPTIGTAKLETDNGHIFAMEVGLDVGSL